MRSQTSGETRREFSVSVFQSQTRATKVDPDRHPDTDKTHTKSFTAPSVTKVVLLWYKVCAEGAGVESSLDGLDTCEQKEEWAFQQVGDESRAPHWDTECGRVSRQFSGEGRPRSLKSCSPSDTMGRAESDVITVRQTSERPQRGLAWFRDVFRLTESRTELLVELCKETGREEAWEVRGATSGPSHATPEVVGKTCAERGHVRSPHGTEVRQRALRRRWLREQSERALYFSRR